MIFKTQEITLDLVGDTAVTIIQFSQGDRNSAKLILNLTNKGGELDLSQAKAVRISFKKPDGTSVFQNDCQPINVLKGKYQILLKTQTLAAVGNVVAQIHIEEEDRMIDTQKFFFVVNESLSGNGAVESTNEFTIIQKAIEAGKKLEGKDIDGIIAAGAKADAALPKTGGTMTGNLKLPRLETTDQTPVIFNGSASNRSWKWDLSGDNISITPTLNGSPGWDASKTIILQNLLKKAEIYSDYVQANGNTKVLSAGTDLNTVQATGASAGSGLVNAPNGDTGFWYVEALRYSDTKYCKQIATSLTGGSSSKVFTRRMVNNVWEVWTESIQSTGGTMTGDLSINKSGAVNKKLAFQKDGTEIFNLYAFSDTHFGIRDVVGNKNVWEYNKVNDEFVVLSNTNLMKKTDYTGKDGQVTLTLTADATNPDANNLTRSVRRGNTVTVHLCTVLNANATGAIVTNIPSDMRPIYNVSTYVPTHDGTATVQVFINASTGALAFTNNAKGKRVETVLTYTAN
ncbi:BppU family phage baseplate upper protein [Bacillus toyonensis]